MDSYYRPIQSVKCWPKVMSKHSSEYEELIDWCGENSPMGRYLIQQEGQEIPAEIRYRFSRFLWLKSPSPELDLDNYVRQMSRWWSLLGKLPFIEKYHELLYPDHPIRYEKGARSADRDRKYSRQSVLDAAEWCGNDELCWVIRPAPADSLGYVCRPRPLWVRDRDHRMRLEFYMTRTRLALRPDVNALDSLNALWLEMYGDGSGNWWRWRSAWAGNLWVDISGADCERWLNFMDKASHIWK